MVQNNLMKSKWQGLVCLKEPFVMAQQGFSLEQILMLLFSIYS
jgi:hypothetical protein